MGDGRDLRLAQLFIFGGLYEVAECEVEGKSKVGLIGLFRERNGDFMASRISFRSRPVGRDEFGRVMVRVKFDGPDDPYFMFPLGSLPITPGPVKTVYASKRDPDEYEPVNADTIGLEYIKRFRLHDQEYTLRGTTGLNAEGQKRFVIALDSDGTSQWIWHDAIFMFDSVQNYVELIWAGDIDRDGKLDIYFSYFKQNGGAMATRLFLSSTAGPGDLVKMSAGYSVSRCGYKS